ncbi:MAG TPA: signal peptidase I [Tetrasphaera sp.]|uniref:signal peptidase I n=1 Tax=Nostocoides sp. TaxID=1917966 RepID=UPI002C82BE83|nr:signal peptidase I [Tetrasphaera sp.]HNQ07105.1 signal peptidase I [Tetrasphaera sp.]
MSQPPADADAAGKTAAGAEDVAAGKGLAATQPGPDARYPMPSVPATKALQGERDTAKPAASKEEERRRPAAALAAAVREFVVVGAIALALSFLVKTFLVQAFYIPSESMESTLVKNDRVIVNKLVPGLIGLHRGDVVVFEDPGNWLSPTPTKDRGPVINELVKAATFVGLLPDTAEGHLIKRVIGLPGDHVTCCDAQGRLSVNGKAINEPYVKAGEKPSEIVFDITVPAGKIWVMGDNRGHSSDSRLHDASGNGSDGSVDLSLVTGRAFVLVWPIGRAGWLSNYGSTFAAVPAP